MAQSVRGLRQSAVLCGPEELPLTIDLLQGSEAVAAVLCRYATVCGTAARRVQLEPRFYRLPFLSPSHKKTRRRIVPAAHKCAKEVDPPKPDLRVF